MGGIRLPGVANQIEARKAIMDQVVAQHFHAITTAPKAPTAANAAHGAAPRRQSAGDLGKRLTTARLP